VIYIYLLTRAGAFQPDIEGMRILYEPDQSWVGMLGPRSLVRALRGWLVIPLQMEI